MIQSVYTYLVTTETQESVVSCHGKVKNKIDFRKRTIRASLSSYSLTQSLKTQESVAICHGQVQSRLIYLLNIFAFFQRPKTQDEGINFPSDLNVEEFLSKLHYEHK